MTSIKNAVVLVTGANGGLGQEFVKQALERGAAKVYATARTPRDWNDDRVVPLRLDVTDEASVIAAAAAAGDTTVVVNNAGIYTHGDTITGTSFAHLREIFETNFFGAVLVNRAFAPILGANGGGAFLDVHSVLSWLGVAGAYSAAKAAFWSATNSFRVELAAQHTQVVGLHLGYTDTPMIAMVDDAKNDPADIVRAGYDGLENNEHEVLADDRAVAVKAALSGSIADLYALPGVPPLTA
ncbi:SDR family oxidoreductase [Winogradskya consettensis]|uniref:Short-chain dehydrogenase n=1 Tax=Winogradskya consettensis TaxID=113560 RepID=A0A919ST37_9ACTN|nr:SDR family oxidoreductase [Actinoplanes consettensis]GIM76443.1 short-chain dehydrogenase [Actinoplanes consettensis]